MCCAHSSAVSAPCEPKKLPAKANHAACSKNHVVVAAIKCEVLNVPPADVQRALTSCIDGTSVKSTGGIGSAQPVTHKLPLSQPNRPYERHMMRLVVTTRTDLISLLTSENASLPLQKSHEHFFGLGAMCAPQVRRLGTICCDIVQERLPNTCVTSCMAQDESTRTSSGLAAMFAQSANSGRKHTDTTKKLVLVPLCPSPLRLVTWCGEVVWQVAKLLDPP